MHRGTGGTVFEPVQPERRDREVTLGPFTLTLFGCGLFALCGMCFVFGYAVGHRAPESSAAISVPPSPAPAFTPQAGAQSKPAAGQGGAAAQAPGAATDMSEPADADSIGAAPAQPSAANTQPAGTSAEPAVRTLVATTPVAQPSPVGSVQPALGQAPGIMVQIAAVTHPEDAEVLVGALRKRGYAVSARRDPADGLLHVQVGPFSSRTDAYAMRQKLLNDGYNAIVQQ